MPRSIAPFKSAILGVVMPHELSVGSLVVLACTLGGCSTFWVGDEMDGLWAGDEVVGVGRPCWDSGTASESCLTSADVEYGEELFFNTCAACHGEDGEGLPGYSPDLNIAFAERSDRELVAVIRQGYGEMPAQSLTADEAAWVVAYGRETFKGVPVFQADWNAVGVHITIENGHGTYTLGMAETDPVTPDPWTGEDCLNGYTSDSGTLYFFCHSLGTTGGDLESVSSLGDIVEGETTIFSDGLEEFITYAIWSEENLDCWTFGHDTSYYTAECVEI